MRPCNTEKFKISSLSDDNDGGAIGDGDGDDGDGDLLPTVRGKVKDKDSEEGYAHARDYQVHLVGKSGFKNLENICSTEIQPCRIRSSSSW